MLLLVGFNAWLQKELFTLSLSLSVFTLAYSLYFNQQGTYLQITISWWAFVLFIILQVKYFLKNTENILEREKVEFYRNIWKKSFFKTTFSFGCCNLSDITYFNAGEQTYSPEKLNWTRMVEPKIRLVQNQVQGITFVWNISFLNFYFLLTKLIGFLMIFLQWYND